MKKVLWLSDFNCTTGFATVAHNIMEQLQKTGEYEFTVIGINHWGDPYDYNKWPFPIYPAIDYAKSDNPVYRDVFGRQRLLDLLGTGDFDILFTLQDHFIIEPIAKQIVQTRKDLISMGKKPFKWIWYFPVDGTMKKKWAETVAMADYPVNYTQFGYNKTKEHGVETKVIPHGTNLKDFYPLTEEEIKEVKKTFFKTDKFIVTNVNRNQPRKDIPRTLLAFKEFHEQRPETVLYLHMMQNDAGGDVVEMATEIGIDPDSLMMPTSHYPVEVLNKIYNASDVVISTTLGEGWGLSCTEAMACKTPVIMPNNSSLVEICDNRGLLALSGKEKICVQGDNNQFRPLTDIDDLVDRLDFVYSCPDKVKTKIEKAYEWVSQLSWENVCKDWIKIFKEASEPIKIIGRREPCPCGSGKKFKNCCGKDGKNA